MKIPSSFAVVACVLASTTVSLPWGNHQSALAVQTKPASQAPDDDDSIPVKWIKVAPAGAWASFEMPIEPTHIERTITPLKDQPPVTLKMDRATLANATVSFLFAYHDFEDTPQPGEIPNILNRTIRNGVANVRGLIREQPKRTDQGLGRNYVFVYSHFDKRYIVHAHLRLVGRRLYQVNIIMEENAYDKTVAARYIRSFKVLEIEDDLPPRPPISD